MYTQKFIRGSLVLTLVLVAGGALAEKPARGGYRNSVPIACASDARGTASYRDSVARLGIEDDARPKVASAGYRDQYARRGSQSASESLVARLAGLACTY